MEFLKKEDFLIARHASLGVDDHDAVLSPPPGGTRYEAGGTSSHSLLPLAHRSFLVRFLVEFEPIVVVAAANEEDRPRVATTASTVMLVMPTQTGLHMEGPSASPIALVDRWRRTHRHLAVQLSTRQETEDTNNNNNNNNSPHTMQLNQLKLRASRGLPAEHLLSVTASSVESLLRGLEADLRAVLPLPALELDRLLYTDFHCSPSDPNTFPSEFVVAEGGEGKGKGWRVLEGLSASATNDPGAPLSPSAVLRGLPTEFTAVSIVKPRRISFLVTALFSRQDLLAFRIQSQSYSRSDLVGSCLLQRRAGVVCSTLKELCRTVSTVLHHAVLPTNLYFLNPVAPRNGGGAGGGGGEVQWDYDFRGPEHYMPLQHIAQLSNFCFLLCDFHTVMEKEETSFFADPFFQERRSPSKTFQTVVGDHEASQLLSNATDFNSGLVDPAVLRDFYSRNPVLPLDSERAWKSESHVIRPTALEGATLEPNSISGTAGQSAADIQSGRSVLRELAKRSQLARQRVDREVVVADGRVVERAADLSRQLDRTASKLLTGEETELGGVHREQQQRQGSSPPQKSGRYRFPIPKNVLTPRVPSGLLLQHPYEQVSPSDAPGRTTEDAWTRNETAVEGSIRRAPPSSSKNDPPRVGMDLYRYVFLESVTRFPELMGGRTPTKDLGVRTPPLPPAAAPLTQHGISMTPTSLPAHPSMGEPAPQNLTSSASASQYQRRGFDLKQERRILIQLALAELLKHPKKDFFNTGTLVQLTSDIVDAFRKAYQPTGTPVLFPLCRMDVELLNNLVGARMDRELASGTILHQLSAQKLKIQEQKSHTGDFLEVSPPMFADRRSQRGLHPLDANEYQDERTAAENAPLMLSTVLETTKPPSVIKDPRRELVLTRPQFDPQRKRLVVFATCGFDIFDGSSPAFSQQAGKYNKPLSHSGMGGVTPPFRWFLRRPSKPQEKSMDSRSYHSNDNNNYVDACLDTFFGLGIASTHVISYTVPITIQLELDLDPEKEAVLSGQEVRTNLNRLRSADVTPAPIDEGVQYIIGIEALRREDLFKVEATQPFIIPVHSGIAPLSKEQLFERVLPFT